MQSWLKRNKYRNAFSDTFSLKTKVVMFLSLELKSQRGFHTVQRVSVSWGFKVCNCASHFTCLKAVGQIRVSTFNAYDFIYCSNIFKALIHSSRQYDNKVKHTRNSPIQTLASSSGAAKHAYDLFPDLKFTSKKQSIHGSCDHAVKRISF